MDNYHKALAHKNLGNLALVASGWAILLVFIGAIVQTTNSGVACPAWLLCYNQALPPLGVVFWLNFTHIAVAGLAVLLAIALAVLVRRADDQAPILPTVNLVTPIAALFQLMLVAGVIWFDNHLLARVIYLLVVIIHLSLTLLLATLTRLPAKYVSTPGLFQPDHKSFFRLLLTTGVALLFVMLGGLIVSQTDSGLACPDWPLCRGQLLPFTTDPAVIINLLHRFTVVAFSILIAAIVLRSSRQFAKQRFISKWAITLGLLFLTQIAVGGWSALMPLPRVVTAAIHLSLTSTIWGSLVILAATFYFTARSLPLETVQERVATNLPLRQKIGVYFKLTKPWIMILLLVTTITAMVIAAKGLPSFWLLLLTTLGGTLAAGGASALNSYIDSDIDQVMSRTSRRATVTGLVTPQETLLFGLTLSALSFFVYALFVNTLSAALSTLGILYYVFFYTLYLKRATLHNIIIGGAAGAIPPLVGWTAVTGVLDLGAFYLFAIIFFWTPPHTWALALLVKKDYARARVPMLPVVVGEKETTYQILLYTILLITITILPVTFNMLSQVYLVAAIALGLPFLYLAWKLWRDYYNKRYSKQLYKFSQLYLALLFLMMAVDRSWFV